MSVVLLPLIVRVRTQHRVCRAAAVVASYYITLTYMRAVGVRWWGFRGIPYFCFFSNFFIFPHGILMIFPSAIVHLITSVCVLSYIYPSLPVMGFLQTVCHAAVIVVHVRTTQNLSMLLLSWFVYIYTSYKYCTRYIFSTYVVRITKQRYFFPHPTITPS